MIQRIPAMQSGRPAIVVDREQCLRVAEILARLGVPDDREEQSPTGLSLEEVGTFYLLLVAICHQTQSLHGVVDGNPCRGWDYLHARLLEAVQRDHGLLTSARWIEITSSQLDSIFADPIAGQTLSDSARRAALIRNLGIVMNARQWSSFNDIHDAAGGQIAGGSPNMCELLAQFEAYNDPVRKKTLFLLGLAANEAGVVYKDVERMSAPVDYHEVRGHLRLRTVRIEDAALAGKLVARRCVSESEDIAIRGAVLAAIELIASQVGRPSPLRLHYTLWNVFRSICLRETPHCRAGVGSADLSPRYSHLVHVEGSNRGCPFVAICPSADLPQRFCEHTFATDWY
jgi:hypothetical protein